MRFFVVLSCLGWCLAAAGQSMNMGDPPSTQIENVERHTGSGTSLEPASSARPMLMRMTESQWMLMLHGEAWAVEQQQSGARGRDKFFSVNWFMPMAQHSMRGGQVTLRAMLSLEPATITGRYFPELFEQGETAFGKPIVDGQHPHNFFMELAGVFDHRLGEENLLTLYAAPVGDPALGPEAFPHRASASEDPLAPLGHHLEDSTHIAYDVITAGITRELGSRGLRLEASGFHGREPDENRWHLEAGAMDSWSARLWIAPGRNWVAQYSLGRLHSPEALHPLEDVLRQTASATWHWERGMAAFDGTAVWGRNHTVGSRENANGYLAEALLHVKRHALWTRIEDADRTSDLLGTSAPGTEYGIGRVQAYSGGYAFRLYAGSASTLELGGQVTGYVTPTLLTPMYGQHPAGVALMLKMQLGK